MHGQLVMRARTADNIPSHSITFISMAKESQSTTTGCYADDVAVGAAFRRRQRTGAVFVRSAPAGGQAAATWSEPGTTTHDVCMDGACLLGVVVRPCACRAHTHTGSPGAHDADVGPVGLGHQLSGGGADVAGRRLVFSPAGLR